MISVKQYYNLLYEKLIHMHQDEFDYCLARDNSASIPPPIGEKYSALKLLLDKVEQKYGFNMKLNYAQLTLWQRRFCAPNESELKENAFYASGAFVLFCCLIDNFLDSPRFTVADKEDVYKKIEQFDGAIYKNNKFLELDILIEQFLFFLNSCSEDANCKKAYLRTEINRAFTSEIYMYKSALHKDSRLSDAEFNLLVDKSVAFEKAALLTASYGNNSAKSLKAAEVMGNIFWLIDDLCDFVEDIRENRKNSLLLYCVKENTNYSLEERVEMVYQNIEIPIQQLFQNINELRTVAGQELYVFMMNQIWKWAFRVREVISDISD